MAGQNPRWTVLAAVWVTICLLVGGLWWNASSSQVRSSECAKPVIAPTPSPPTPSPASTELDRVAIIIVGGLRTFWFTQKNIWTNVVDALQPDPGRRRIFIETSNNTQDCAANPVNFGHVGTVCLHDSDRSIETLNHVATFPDVEVHLENNFSCAHPHITNHVCCSKPSFMQHPPVGLWGLRQYMRRDLAFQRVFDYEKANEMRFDYIVMLRPDLFFFEPMPPVSYLTRLPPELVTTIKEVATPQMADYMFRLPRSLGERFQMAQRMAHVPECAHGQHLGFIPEDRLAIYLREKRTVPFRASTMRYAVTKGRNHDPMSSRASFVHECWRMEHPLYPPVLTQWLMPDAPLLEGDGPLDLGAPVAYCNRFMDTLFPPHPPPLTTPAPPETTSTTAPETTTTAVAPTTPPELAATTTAPPETAVAAAPTSPPSESSTSLPSQEATTTTQAAAAPAIEGLAAPLPQAAVASETSAGNTT